MDSYYIYSKSGKTRYNAMLLTNGETIKVRYNKHVELINRLFSAEATLESFNKNRHWFLSIDQTNCGELTKKDYTKLTNLQNELRNLVDNNSQITHQPSLPLLSGDENSDRWSETLVHSGSGVGDRNQNFSGESISLVQSGSSILEILQREHERLEYIERNGNELEKLCAGVRRGQLEIAVSQHNIRVGQAEIRRGQAEIRDGQREIRNGQRRIGKNFQILCSAMRDNPSFSNDGLDEIEESISRLHCMQPV